MLAKKGKVMAFKKQGDVTIAKVLCGCGAELSAGMQKCGKCGKVLTSKSKEKKNDS